MAKSTEAVNVSLTTIAFAAAFLLSGCNTKPSTSDISKELQDAYDCPFLEVTDVNKTDGASRNDGGYEVAFTYQVNFKGGPDKAVRYFYDWNALENERDPLIREHASDMMDKVTALDRKIADFQPCPRVPYANGDLNGMREAAQQNSTLPPEKYQIPIAIRHKGDGVMSKTETGWHFAMPFGMSADAEYVQVSAKPVSPPAASTTAP